MTFSHCHKCPRRQPPPHRGQCLCTVNGKDIMRNVEANYCPLGKFGPASLGDWLHTFFVLTRIHNFVKWWSDLTKSYCDCDRRREEFNAQWRVFWHDAGTWFWTRRITSDE